MASPPKKQKNTMPIKFLAVNWMRSLGLFMIGLGVVFIGFTGYRLVELSHDQSARSECRSALITQEQELQGEINTFGWEALLAEVGGATDDETAQRAEELSDLVDQWRDARDRRNRADELCN